MASKYLNLTGLTYFWGRIQALFVAKETGKVLSSNDYTDEDKAEVAKIAGLVATGGEPNVIETVKVNGTALKPDANKAVNVITPTTRVSTSDGKQDRATVNGYTLAGQECFAEFATVANGVRFTTGIDDNEATTSINVTLPDEARVNALIAAAVTEGVGDITSFRYEPVATLPASGENGVIYLVPNSGSAPNIKDEYIWINKGTAESPDYAFELLGTTELDLSNYLQTTDIEAITTAEIDEITAA